MGGRALKGGHQDRRLSQTSTPLLVAAWKAKLSRHPDQDYAQYIVQGLEEGFHIGVGRDQEFKSAKQNMQSALQNPDIMEEYLGKEVVLGNILGPFSRDLAPLVHINRFGAIPKKNQPGKWRLITDLSHPAGASINDAIDPAVCSLIYITVDQVAAKAMSFGTGALIAKIDIKSAYRLVPVHPDDRPWLGMQWMDRIYVDTKLPFGLRSAPKIFNALADGLEWCVAAAGVPDIFHYLDDFAVVGPPGSDLCLQYLSTLKRVCQDLGVPLAPEKEEGPSTKLTLLGIEIDTVKGELRLPEDKLHRLLGMLGDWHAKKCCTRRELESLIGSLHHATKVIRPGRSFLRRIIALLSMCKRRHHHVRLNAEFRADLAWWLTFASHWNGTSLLIHRHSPTTTFCSDASGSWGCGAWHNTNWFQIQWDANSLNLHISAKELIPVIVAAVVWGPQWKGYRVTALSDNSAVVATLNSRYARDKMLMQMLRSLFFLEAHFQCEITAKHIPGRHNDLADDLSRNHACNFLIKNPEACANPTDIPISLLQWILHPSCEWTSPTWMAKFTSFVRKE